MSLRPRLRQRERTARCDRRLESPLPLPSAPHRLRRAAPGLTPPRRRRQRHDQLQLEPRKAVVAPACPPQKSACCPGTGEDPSSKTIPLNTPNASSISGLSAVHRVASSFQGEAPYAFITGSRRVQFWKSKSFTT